MKFSHKVLTILKNIFVKRYLISVNIFWWFLMFFWRKRKLKSAARDPQGYYGQVHHHQVLCFQLYGLDWWSLMEGGVKCPSPVSFHYTPSSPPPLSSPPTHSPFKIHFPPSYQFPIFSFSQILLQIPLEHKL